MVRLRLSVTASTIKATLSGPYASTVISSRFFCSDALEMARSMLSLGTLFCLAVSTAVRKRGLKSGLGSDLAATEIAFKSLEKTTAFFLSAIRFWCLIWDHLECPDIFYSNYSTNRHCE